MTTSVERRKEEPGPAVENCPGQKAGAPGGRAGGIVGPGRSGRQQAGEASPLSSLHHSTARWSQVGAQRRPRQYSRLRPAVLGCGRCSHSLLWRRTWGMMGLRTVHPNTGWVALEVGRQQAKLHFPVPSLRPVIHASCVRSRSALGLSYLLYEKGQPFWVSP